MARQARHQCRYFRQRSKEDLKKSKGWTEDDIMNFYGNAGTESRSGERMNMYPIAMMRFVNWPVHLNAQSIINMHDMT